MTDRVWDRQSILKLLGIVGIWTTACLAYSNSFTIAFQFDDTHTVQMNMYMRSLKYIPEYFVNAKTFSYRPENSGYRPMTSTALALGFALSGLKTWGYHLLKLLEHCLVATLIVLVGLRVLPSSGAASSSRSRLLVALSGGLLFAVHRANTETVDYISAVSTLQAGLFHLLGFYLYIKRTESESRRRRGVFLALSALCYLASMLSKEEGVTLPAMIFFYEWIMLRGPDESYWERLKRNLVPWAKILAVYAGVAAAYLYLHAVFQPAVADTSRGSVPTFIYFITQFRSWLYYWKLFFWPVTLNADNLAFDFSPGLEDWRVWASLATHAAIWTAAWLWGRRQRFVLFAVAWAYITVLPASSVFRLVEAVNEHRMYIPFMFLSLLVAWFVFEAAMRARPREGRSVAIVVVVVCASLLGYGAYARNEVWQTDVSLWEDVIEKNPDSVRAMNILGVSLLNRNEAARAVPLLERCHRMAPSYLPCIVHLSMGYAVFRRYDDGLKILRYGNSLDPNYPHINFHLGLYYKEYFGDFASARRHLERVVQVTEGRFFPATLKLAEMDLEEGRIREGMNWIDTIVKVDPSNGDAAEVHAKGLMLAGQHKDAAEIFGQLMRMAPHDPRFALDMANVLERGGQLADALGLFKQVTEGAPASSQAWAGLARVAEKMGDKKTAATARAKYAEIKASGNWLFFPSMVFLGDRPGMVRPE